MARFALGRAGHWREADQGGGDGPGQGQQAQRDIGRLHRVGLDGAEVFERCWREAVGGRIDAGEDEVAADHHAGDRAQRVEGLGQVQPPRRALGRPQHGHQRIGRGFEEGEAAGDHEQRAQEEAVDPRLGRGEEQQRAHAVKHQPQHHRRLVAPTLCEGRRGEGEDEVAEIEGRLDQAGLEVAERERLAEMGDQHVVEIVRHAPQEEQADDQNHGEDRRRDRQRQRAGLPSLSVHRPALPPGLSPGLPLRDQI